MLQCHNNSWGSVSCGCCHVAARLYPFFDCQFVSQRGFSISVLSPNLRWSLNRPQNLWPHIWIMNSIFLFCIYEWLLWPVKQFYLLSKAAFLPFVYLTGNACVAAYFFRLCYIKVCRWQRSITCKIYELTFLQFTKQQTFLVQICIFMASKIEKIVCL